MPLRLASPLHTDRHTGIQAYIYRRVCLYHWEAYNYRRVPILLRLASPLHTGIQAYRRVRALIGVYEHL
jgi:hypothetical protein